MLEMFPNIDGTSRKMPGLLPSGSFTLAKARKKFLPRAKPEMGFGLLFVVKSENTSGHEKERVVKSESADAAFHDDGDDDDDDDDDDECGSGRGSRRIDRNERGEPEEEQETGNQMVNELAAQVNEKASIDDTAREITTKQNEQRTKKKRISAAQRKQMKKGVRSAAETTKTPPTKTFLTH